jgi:hypothetical protein
MLGQSSYQQALNSQEKVLFQDMTTMGFKEEHVIACFKSVVKERSLDNLLDWMLSNPEPKISSQPIVSSVVNNGNNINRKASDSFFGGLFGASLKEKVSSAFPPPLKPLPPVPFMSYSSKSTHKNSLDIKGLFGDDMDDINDLVVSGKDEKKVNVDQYANELNAKISKIFNKSWEEMANESLIFFMDLKKSTLAKDKEILSSLATGQLTQVNNLKNNIFNMLLLMLQKAKKNKLPKQSKIDDVLIIFLQFKIATSNQLIKIKEAYSRVCSENGFSESIETKNLITNYNSSKPLTIVATLPEIDKLPPSKFFQTTTSPEVMVKVEVKTTEEAKDSVTPDKTPSSKYDKEFCVICMAKAREIVFLPCRHFLTCNSCGPKFKSCPICEKKCESQMKIFWS